MVLCVGEILVDMIAVSDNGNISYQRKAGGAPFNVACAINKFGGKASFVGSVGNDTIGSFLQDFIKKQNLANYYLYQHQDRNTTLAFVDLDSEGERSFCFYRKNTADYILPQIKDEMIDEVNIVHVGSLMLSEIEGIKFAKELIKISKDKGKIISFDVNYRTDIFPNQKYAISVYKEIIELADIVKFSEDEVEIFTQEYVDNLTDKLLCISLGKDGSMYQYKGEKGTVSSIKVKPVDTTGAGDAFYAGILSKISEVNKDNWSSEVFKEAFLFGNICGALNTLGKGAIDNLPTQEEVLEIIASLKE